jgi:hypothetical protein
VQVIFRESKVLGDRGLTSSHMNLSSRYSLLLKHLDKPQCFLEDKLFRECVSNFQKRELISGRCAATIHEAAEGPRISVLESAYLPPVQPATSLDHAR